MTVFKALLVTTLAMIAMDTVAVQKYQQDIQQSKNSIQIDNQYQEKLQTIKQLKRHIQEHLANQPVENMTGRNIAD